MQITAKEEEEAKKHHIRIMKHHKLNRSWSHNHSRHHGNMTHRLHHGNGSFDLHHLNETHKWGFNNGSFQHSSNHSKHDTLPWYRRFFQIFG